MYSKLVKENTVVNIENKVLQLLPVARGNPKATLRTNNDPVSYTHLN